MTKRQKKPLSLNMKVLYVMLIAAAAALLVFVAICGIGKFFIKNYYMSGEAVSARKTEIFNDFSTYVAKNGVTGHDSAAVARWTEEHDYVTIMVFSGSNLKVRAHDGKVYQAPFFSNYEEEEYAAYYGKLYTVRFSNGFFKIAIVDNSQTKQNLLAEIVAAFSACIVFIIVMLLYVSRLTRRIIALSRETMELGAGGVTKAVTVSGTDEIAQLAQEINNMCDALIQRMGNEQRAWQANSDLITAISHDIRTPMTSIIGYLELLNEADYTDREYCYQLTSSAHEKAMELKDLTDELFKYFLVFGKSDLELNMEPFDAQLLLEQLIGESVFDLRDSGFAVTCVGFEGECMINADPLYLKRVFDNLVSNVKKYAEKSRPVMVLSELNDDRLSICFSNSVAKSMAKVESTKIGIRTCEKIVEHMGGGFKTEYDGEHFAAELTLPVTGTQMPLK